MPFCASELLAAPLCGIALLCEPLWLVLLCGSPELLELEELGDCELVLELLWAPVLPVAEDVLLWEDVGGSELLVLLEAGGWELCGEVLCNALGPELLVSSGGGGVLLPGVAPDLLHESEMC